MNPLKRFARLFACLAVVVLFAGPSLSLAGTAQEVPWLYRNSDVPQDKEWKFGELPNGMATAGITITVIAGLAVILFEHRAIARAAR